MIKCLCEKTLLGMAIVMFSLKNLFFVCFTQVTANIELILLCYVTLLTYLNNKNVTSVTFFMLQLTIAKSMLFVEFSGLC